MEGDHRSLSGSKALLVLEDGTIEGFVRASRAVRTIGFSLEGNPGSCQSGHILNELLTELIPVAGSME